MGLFKNRKNGGKADKWEEFARLTKSEFVPGSITKSPRVITKYKTWEIILDKYTVSSQYSHQVYTRITTYYKTTDNFTFKISRKKPYYRLAKFFGIKDIEVGMTDFDNEFLIQGNDRSKLISLFSDNGLREAVRSMGSIQIKSKRTRTFFNRKFPDDVYSIVYHDNGMITDQEILLKIHKLMSLFLEQLFNIGSATKEIPNYEN